MKHLVIGYKGEVGSAVKKVLEEKHDVTGLDRGNVDDLPEKGFDVLHICIPYNDEFVNEVKRYKNLFLKEGGIVINHSTVPIGTSDELDAVHSPIRGIHPHLYDGVKTFTKYFGGKHAPEASAFFKECGVETICTANAKETEAMKMWSTTYYGWNIIFEKMVHEYCEEHGLDFNLVYTHSNMTYNIGYTKLKKFEVIRPVLRHMKGKIGGHCIVPNCELLGGDIAEFILSKNDVL